jgi:hypothetical protein
VDYTPKTTPWAHQQAAFDISFDKANFACLMEQRCGKTKVIIDTVAYQYEQGIIDALIVVALPSGVHINWTKDEIPTHLPDRIPYKSVTWNSQKARTKTFQEDLKNLLYFKGLAVLSVNGEAIITETFRAYIALFLKLRKIFLAADETTLIMLHPGTQRSKMMLRLGRHPNVKFRRIMDGTPSGEGPFDLYTQFSFLDPRILGYTSFFAFKQRYAEWSTGYNGATGREYPVLEKYKNLDELASKIAPHSFRVTRKEAFPNMPDQIICHIRFELTSEQRRVYDQLSNNYEAELRDMTTVTAHHVLTRLMRLQQVGSNRWPSEKAFALCTACEGAGCEACDRVGAIETSTPAKIIDPLANPRLEALKDQITRTSDPFIVWCRFTTDVDDVLNLCTEMGRSPVRYDGKTSQDEKTQAREAFKYGAAGALVGNPNSGGRGLTLKSAKTIFNFSHFFSLLVYLQGNDRAEDPLAQRGTAIVDLIAEGTVDDDIAEAHRAKKSVVDLIIERRRLTK